MKNVHGAVCWALVAAGVVSSAAAAPQVGGTQGGRYVGEQTSRFRVVGGPDGDVLFSVSSAFEVDVSFSRVFTGRRGYQYWQSRSDLAAAGMHSNPLYQQNGQSGDNPLYRSPTIQVLPINDPPVPVDGAGLYTPDGTDPAAAFELWEGVAMRVKLFDDAGEVTGSFLAEGGLTLTGGAPGSLFEAGVPSTLTYQSDPGSLKWMAPEAIRSRGAMLDAGLYLEEITITATLVPGPGVGALMLAGVWGAAARRRR